MANQILKDITTELQELSKTSTSSNLIYRQGHSLYLNGQCTQLSASENHFEFSVNDKYGDFLVKIDTGQELKSSCECKTGQICRHRAAALMQLHELIKLEEDNLPPAGIKYTRSGMIKRVVEERKEKALKARYTIQYAENIFGEHILTNERGVKYRLTFRDIERKHGYCSCPDYKTNKLGTCKHLIFAFETFINEHGMPGDDQPKYPFIEVFLNPFRDYKISWFYPEKIVGEVAELFYRYFGNRKYIEDDEAENLVGFFNNLDRHKQILVRPEVYEKVEKISELNTLNRIKAKHKPDFSSLRTELLPFQKEGVEFATFKKGAIIADEIGLGKTLQAIATAIKKKEILGFTKTLVICPATHKNQWKNEAETFTGEDAVLVEGTPEERRKKYSGGTAFFRIVSYETVIRDRDIIPQFDFDFLILDEAQRIKNYASRTYTTIKAIPRKHALVLTGTPIETELIELYSIVLFVDPELLSPLWEFSYQHCYFDSQNRNTIVGYYNLGELKEKLTGVLLRRERQEVIRQLPNISQITNPVKLSAYQKKLHMQYAREILDIYSKKIISSFDMQKSLQLLRQMRMVCNSTFLVDDATNISPKLDELKHILSYKLHIRKNPRKVIIFTEWEKMVNIIARNLRLNKIKFLEITGKLTQEQQKEIFRQFELDDTPKILLCTEEVAGEINLGFADTVINMEVPRSSRAKNLRLGSIDVLGKRPGNLTIINLVAENSIEEKIAGGIEFEGELTDKLLNPGNDEQLVELSGMMQTKYTKAISDTIERMILSEEIPDNAEPETGNQMKLDFDADEETDIGLKVVRDEVEHKPREAAQSEPDDLGRFDSREIEEVLQSGVGFLSQLLKMSTGREITLEKENLQFDPDTGEIILKFRVPGR